MTDSFRITEVDPRAPEVLVLLERHLSFNAEVTPPEDIHALDLDGLLDPSVTLYGLRNGGSLLGIGALKQLDEQHIEIKSMHTVEAARGRGVARAMLDHLLAIAAGRRARRVSLETGSQDAFLPAIALYTGAGFERCGPFADYRNGTSSVFMTLEFGGIE
jgi:putative acetyltransferase